MQVHNGRYTAQVEGDFVVFLIGMRINRLPLIHKWMPVVLAMPPMITELYRRPELGMFHAHTFLGGRTIMVVQYWRSFDHLLAYAQARDLKHLPAWSAFNRKVGENGSVGIFHESYLIKAGQYECVYTNMPAVGLARAGEMVPAEGRMRSAHSRLGAKLETEGPAPS